MAPSIMNKSRKITSYENMTEELKAAFDEKYPHGYADYMGDIIKVDKPDGTFFHAVTVEIPDAVYLIKIKVKTDDYEDVEKALVDDEGGDEDSFPTSDDDFAGSSDDESDEE